MKASKLTDLIYRFCEAHSDGNSGGPMGTCSFRMNNLSHWEFEHPDQDYDMQLPCGWGDDLLIAMLKKWSKSLNET